MDKAEFEEFKKVFIKETQHYNYYPGITMSLSVWWRLFKNLCDTQEADSPNLKSDSSETYSKISRFFDTYKNNPAVKKFLVEQIKLLGNQNGDGKTNLEQQTMRDLNRYCHVKITNEEMNYPLDSNPYNIGGYRKSQSIKTKKRKNIKNKKLLTAKGIRKVKARKSYRKHKKKVVKKKARS